VSFMFNTHIPMGIEQDYKEVVCVPNEMRRRIEKARRDSALIAQTLRNAEYEGWSGEDKYVVLAYRALVALERLHKQMLSYMQQATAPPPRDG
jgi:hypothetical protein